MARGKPSLLCLQLLLLNHDDDKQQTNDDNKGSDNRADLMAAAGAIAAVVIVVMRAGAVVGVVIASSGGGLGALLTVALRQNVLGHTSSCGKQPEVHQQGNKRHVLLLHCFPLFFLAALCNVYARVCVFVRGEADGLNDKWPQSLKQ